MRQNDPSILETQKSAPAGTSMVDWAPKFCDDRDHALEGLSQAFLRSYSGRD